MRDEWGSSQAELLRVDARHEGPEATITVEGELDYSTAEQFRTCVLEVLDTKPHSITIDAHAVRTWTRLAARPCSELTVWPSLTK